MATRYQLWTRPIYRPEGPPSEDRAALERKATAIAEDGYDTCVYEEGVDANDEDDEDWEVG